MASLFEAADVVLNTSRSEGLSHALLEGMSLGKPVLASRVPGNEDLIEHGVDGLLYRSPQELYLWAKLLLLNPSLRKEMGRKGKLKVREQYSYEGEMQRFASLYKSLLVQRDPSAARR
mgnify:CR=1 FL=1